MSDPGVIFDVDGTLLDTNYLHTIAWTRALRSHGVEDVSMADVHRAIGIASEGLVEHLTGSRDEELAGAEGKFYAPFKDDIRAFPRAADLLQACRDAGLSVVIATSGKKDDLEWMLPAIGVEEDLLTGAVTSSDVEEAKPAPELMQVAMDKFGLDPDRTVAIGDTVWDVKSAASAGIRCVAVASGGIGGPELREAGAVEVWDDAADIVEHLGESVISTLAR